MKLMFPCYRYHADGRTQYCETPEDADALGPEWGSWAEIFEPSQRQPEVDSGDMDLTKMKNAELVDILVEEFGVSKKELQGLKKDDLVARVIAEEKKLEV